MRDLCDSARKGHPCIDSLCRGGGETLCGFDQYFYDELMNEEAVREFDDCDPYDDPSEAV